LSQSADFYLTAARPQLHLIQQDFAFAGRSSMSELWNEYHRRIHRWQQAGAKECLRLLDLYQEGIRHRETNPEQTFRLYTQARDEAKSLHEPWWVLFFERCRLCTLTGDLEDYARALPLAMELVVRFHQREGQAHPCHGPVLTEVLCTYLNIDAHGYRNELEQGFAHLDARTALGPVSERFVLHHRWTDYLLVTERSV
jgi:hypothetical protein